MADIASSNVTYTAKTLRKKGDSRNHHVIQLVFGDGALTVPAGGIPLLKGKMGCPVNVESLKVVAQGTSGYVFNYVPSTEKLVVLYADYDAVADGALIQATGVAIAAQTIEVEVIGY